MELGVAPAVTEAAILMIVCQQVYEESSEQTLGEAGLSSRQEMLLLEPKG